MQRLLPPHMFLLLAALSTLTSYVWPIVGGLPRPLRATGVGLLAASLFLTVSGARLFRRLDTNIKTFDEPDRLVTTGSFRFSRNPMYLGFLLALVGVALVAGSLAAWVGPVLFGAIAQRWYIPFEERRMSARFGSAYLRYRDDVGRWLTLPGGFRL